MHKASSPEPCAFSGCEFACRAGWPVCVYHGTLIAEDVAEWGGATLPQVRTLNEVRRQANKLRRENASHKRAGTVYYLRLDNTIKIGWTADLAQRLKSYPPYAEVLAREPGTRADERDLHRTFKPSRTHGREWYAPTPELVAHIDRINAERCAEEQRKADERRRKAAATRPKGKAA